jgi:hypothetical protein
MSIPELWSRMRAPLVTLLKWALGCTLWVVAGYFATQGANVQGVDAHLVPLILWYFSGALIIALVIGVLRDWMTSRWRGALVGAFCAVLVEVTFTLGVFQTSVKVGAMILSALLVAPLGAAIGAMYWSPR